MVAQLAPVSSAVRMEARRFTVCIVTAAEFCDWLFVCDVTDAEHWVWNAAAALSERPELAGKAASTHLLDLVGEFVLHSEIIFYQLKGLTRVNVDTVKTEMYKNGLPFVFQRAGYSTCWSGVSADCQLNSLLRALVFIKALWVLWAKRGEEWRALTLPQIPENPFNDKTRKSLQYSNLIKTNNSLLSDTFMSRC